MREARRLLKQRDEDQSALNAHERAGLQPLERGEGRTMDLTSTKAIAAAIEKRSRARLARGG